MLGIDFVVPTWVDEAFNYTFNDFWNDAERLIRECEDASVAANNCNKVADSIKKRHPEFKVIQLNCPPEIYGNGRTFAYHCANYNKYDDLIIDFTIKQFDNTLPFPYLGTLWEWQEIIGPYLGLDT